MSQFPPVGSDPYPYVLTIDFLTGDANDLYTLSLADFPLLEDSSPDPAAIAALIETALAANPYVVLTLAQSFTSSLEYEYGGSSQTISAAVVGTLTGVDDIYNDALGITPPSLSWT